MGEWLLTSRDLKRYPHFDPVVSAKAGQAYATDSGRVARHAFLPFIQYSQRWTRFPKEGEPRPPKDRPIRYAARRDAYIFAYYRHLLSQRYEEELTRLDLGASILAYRHVPLTNGEGGKCNVHFAFDAFRKIRELGDCCAIALDVSGFFESLDHSRLKAVWCRMLGVSKLPVDHFRVFTAITKYAWVEKTEAYERLGHFGDKKLASGSVRKGYLTPYKEIPKRLCNGTDFRLKIAGANGQKSIIKRNYKTYGIPQGAPISDLLANLYLIDFDAEVSDWVRRIGGAYFRYSDDILILTPGDATAGRALMRRTTSLIANFGEKLKIKPEKSSLVVFHRRGANQHFELDHGTQGKNGLEYLGFRYDGRRVFLRDASLSNFLRKIARAAYREAWACARRYPDKGVTELRLRFDYEKLIKRFGRVEDFGELKGEYHNWTFWTYAKRASKTFGPLGKPILRQLRKHRDLIRRRADKALDRAVARRERRKLSPKAKP
jgi:hypothetical protein